MSNDSLGDRMKRYEDVWRLHLPRRSYTLIRVDGKAFHTYTANAKCERPFDEPFTVAMNETALALCREIQNAVFAYVQSDEISVLLTDFATVTTEPWFGGNIQKIVSISAACATAAFNSAREQQAEEMWTQVVHPRGALFDSRVWIVPERHEVANYFLWRMQDATRNSLSALAQSHFSHKQLHGKNQADMHEMLHSVGVNWNNLEGGYKRGRIVAKPRLIDRPGSWQVFPAQVWKVEENNELMDLIPKRD